MLIDKRSKLGWIGIIVLGLILLGMPLAHANDLEEIAANRDVVIEELVQMWFMDEPGWEEDLRSALSLANDSKLLAIQNAKSYAEVQAILSGGTPDDFGAAGLDTPFALGDTDKDFVYTPVNPCRIIDTRISGGKIPTNTSRDFYVYGSGAQMSAQGGNPAGCTSPRGEPRAVHMNIVAVNSNAPGWLTVWPKGTARPLAGVLNYSPTDKTDPISNSFTVKTGFGLGQDISVYARQTTHVVSDVMGYYYDVDEDDFKMRFAGSKCEYSTFLYTGGGCTNYACGQVSIYVPGPGKVKVDAQAVLNLSKHTQGTADDVTVYIGETASDCTFSNASQGYHAMQWSIPANFPGWIYYLRQTVPVSRTFTVTSAGTKKYYLNGKRHSGVGGNLHFEQSSMQAVYYPDF